MQLDAGGTPTAWAGSTDGTVRALGALSNGGLVAGGTFAFAGGQPRSNLAVLDGNGIATSIDLGTDGEVLSVATRGSDVIAGGGFATAGGAARSHLAMLDSETGAVADWNPGANYAVRALQVVGGTVYAGGEFTQIGSSPRGRAAGLSVESAEVTSFDPGFDGPVNAIARTTAGSLVLGGAFEGLTGVQTPGVAFFGGS